MKTILATLAVSVLIAGQSLFAVPKPARPNSNAHHLKQRAAAAQHAAHNAANAKRASQLRQAAAQSAANNAANARKAAELHQVPRPPENTPPPAESE